MSVIAFDSRCPSPANLATERAFSDPRNADTVVCMIFVPRNSEMRPSTAQNPLAKEARALNGHASGRCLVDCLERAPRRKRIFAGPSEMAAMLKIIKIKILPNLNIMIEYWLR